LNLSSLASYRRVASSGSVTNATEPPQTLYYIPINQFEVITDSFLSKERLRKKGLDKKQVFSTCTQFVQDSEADVIGACSAYTLQPILELFNVMFGDKYLYQQELSQRTEVMEGEGVAKPKTSVRFDLLFRKR
jgi:hypothetical protein